MRGSFLVAAALLLALAPSAGAQGSGGTAPLYPGNTIELRTTGPIVAGQPAKLALSGTLAYDEPDDTRVDYTLHISAHNAAIDPGCEVSKSAQSQKFINLGDAFDANAGFGFFFDDGRTVSLPPPTLTGPWAGESLLFVVKPQMPEVVFCGYLAYITDDVAWYRLPVQVLQPGQEPPPGEGSPSPGQAAPSCRVAQRRVRRGRALRLTCVNLAPGKLTVRFRRKGAPTRTATARLKGNGTARVSTRRLRRGRYRVTVSRGSTTLGQRRSLRVVR